MQRPDLATLACVNADCQHFGRTGQGNLTLRKVYGKDGIRLLRCRSCHEEFSERRNTALFNTKVSEAKAESIIDHLDEGCSVRATSRLTKAAKVTVARLLKTSGRHAQRFHDQEVKDLRPRAIQFDEQWSFVKKKQKHCNADEAGQAGDFWDHTAVAPDSKFIVSLVVGKRTQQQTQELLSDTQSRLRKRHLPVLFSDGYEGYEPAILEVFGRRYAAPKTGLVGRPCLDIIRWPQGLAYGQVVKSTKEKLSDGIHLKVIRGKAQLLHTLSLLGYEKINTSSVERHNGTSRLHNQRKVRKTLAFSKSHLYHGWMSWLSVVQYNFCRAHGSLRIKDERGFHHRTPAMAAGLTNRIWSTRDWLLNQFWGGKDHHRTRPSNATTLESKKSVI
jgi:IS1 family transposase/transposase-like protein